MSTETWEAPEVARERMRRSLDVPTQGQVDRRSRNTFDLWQRSEAARGGMGFAAFCVAYGFTEPKPDPIPSTKTEPTVDDLLAEAARLSTAADRHALEAARYHRNKDDAFAISHATRAEELRKSANALRARAKTLSQGASS